MRRPMIGLAAATVLLLLAACGDADSEDSAATEPAATGTPATETPTTAEPDPTGPPATIEIVEVIEGIEWYEPCRNEPLPLDGTKWWPLLPEELEALDESLYPLPAEPQGIATRIAPPGPGDDVGTLVVYDDGLARFESDSGDIVMWLDQTERDYNWVC